MSSLLFVDVVFVNFITYIIFNALIIIMVLYFFEELFSVCTDFVLCTYWSHVTSKFQHAEIFYNYKLKAMF